MQTKKLVLFCFFAIVLSIYGISKIPAEGFKHPQSLTYIKDALMELNLDFTVLPHPKTNDELEKINNEEIDAIFEDIIKKQKKKALEYERMGAYSKAHDIYIQIIGIDRFDEDAWNGIINSLEKREKLEEARRMEQMMKKVFEMKN